MEYKFLVFHRSAFRNQDSYRIRSRVTATRVGGVITIPLPYRSAMRENV